MRPVSRVTAGEGRPLVLPSPTVTWEKVAEGRMRASLANRSISFVTSGLAGAPSAVLNLMPLYSGGLWLAVKLIPPAAFRFWI